MPNPNITTTYAGEAAGKYIASALLSANTIEGGGVTVVPNIKFRQTMKLADVNAGIKDATCAFDNQGQITLTERVLEPKELQVNQTLCLPEFRKDWDAISMGYSVYDNLPPSFQEWLISYMLGKVAAKTEIDLWKGDKANNGEFDGIEKQLAAAVVAGEIPAAQAIAAAAVTPANVVEKMGLVIDAAPDSIYSKENTLLYVPINVYKAYTRALGGFAANGVGANGYENRGNNQAFDTGLMFDGVRLFCAHGMTADKMVLTTSENLFFGTGLLSDMNEVKLLDMRETTGSQEARVIMRYTAGATYGQGSDIVTYGL